MNRQLKIGLGGLAVYIVFNRFMEIPEILQGIVFGIAAIFLIIGILPEHVRAKIKAWKS